MQKLISLLIVLGFMYSSAGFAKSSDKKELRKIESAIDDLKTSIGQDLQAHDENIHSQIEALQDQIDSLSSGEAETGCVNGKKIIISFEGDTRLTCGLPFGWGVNLETGVVCEDHNACQADFGSGWADFAIPPNPGFPVGPPVPTEAIFAFSDAGLLAPMVLVRSGGYPKDGYEIDPVDRVTCVPNFPDEHQSWFHGHVLVEASPGVVYSLLAHQAGFSSFRRISLAEPFPTLPFHIQCPEIIEAP
jgi:hypothetical protein